VKGFQGSEQHAMGIAVFENRYELEYEIDQREEQDQLYYLRSVMIDDVISM